MKVHESFTDPVTRMVGTTVMSNDKLGPQGTPRFRFELTRQWGNGATLGICMLNPSTADARVPDATIARVCAFAKRDGYGSIRVVNLYAFRARDPVDLLMFGASGSDLATEDNAAAICAAVKGSHAFVCAWGATNGPGGLMTRDHIEATIRDALGSVSPMCWGTTQKGFPRHPLYLRGDSTLIPFPVRGWGIGTGSPLRRFIA